MHEKKITHKILGQKINLSREAISHYLNGRRRIPVETLAKMAEILQTDIGELMERPVTTHKVIKYPRTTDSLLTIPLVSWEVLNRHSSLIESIKQLREGDYMEYKTYLGSGMADKQLIAIEVLTDEMVSPHPDPLTIYPESIIIIDSEREPKHGDIVLTRDQRKRWSMGKYAKTGNQQTITPLNPRYPILNGEEVKIEGVIIKVERTLTNP